MEAFRKFEDIQIQQKKSMKYVQVKRKLLVHHYHLFLFP